MAFQVDDPNKPKYSKFENITKTIGNLRQQRKTPLAGVDSTKVVQQGTTQAENQAAGQAKQASQQAQQQTNNLDKSVNWSNVINAQQAKPLAPQQQTATVLGETKFQAPSLQFQNGVAQSVRPSDVYTNQLNAVNAQYEQNLKTIADKQAAADAVKVAQLKEVDDRLTGANTGLDALSKEKMNYLDELSKQGVGNLGTRNTTELDAQDVTSVLADPRSGYIGALSALLGRDYNAARFGGLDAGVYQGDINKAKRGAKDLVLERQQAESGRDVALKGFGDSLKTGRESVSLFKDTQSKLLDETAKRQRDKAQAEFVKASNDLQQLEKSAQGFKQQDMERVEKNYFNTGMNKIQKDVSDLSKSIDTMTKNTQKNFQGKDFEKKQKIADSIVELQQQWLDDAKTMVDDAINRFGPSDPRVKKLQEEIKKQDRQFVDMRIKAATAADKAKRDQQKLDEEIIAKERLKYVKPGMTEPQKAAAEQALQYNVQVNGVDAIKAAQAKEAAGKKESYKVTLTPQEQKRYDEDYQKVLAERKAVSDKIRAQGVK